MVAPRPDNKLLSSDGDLAQIKAWNEETVKTPNLLSVFLVGRDTWVSSVCNGEKKVDIVSIMVQIKYVVTSKLY